MATIKPILEADTFRRDVEIPEIDLDGAFRSQASLFAHYASLYFEAMQQVSTLKMLYDLKCAQADKRLRDADVEEVAASAAAAVGTPAAKAKKPITEAAIEAQIARTADCIAAKLAYNKANGILELCKNALEAFRQRRDMLIQLGANAREEMKGELVGRGIAESRRAAMQDATAQLREVFQEKYALPADTLTVEGA